MANGLARGRIPILRNGYDWSRILTAEQWDVYRPLIASARERRIPFALGGSFALTAYIGGCRKTKDLDVYVKPNDRESMIGILADHGLEDYYQIAPYDRGWIYRSHSGELIVDVIWGMANRRAEVDDGWIAGGPKVDLWGERVRMVPPEEILWGKLYVLQRDRCDWPDIFNLIHETGADLDWRHLLDRMKDDAPLLMGAMNVFAWLFPERARDLPEFLRFAMAAASAAQPDPELRRVRLLDSRPWFRPDSDTDC